MDQLSRTSLFSELSDLSVTGIDDGDQYKNIEANVPKTVSKTFPVSLASVACCRHATAA